MANYKLSIPRGAAVTVSGTTSHATYDAIDHLREAVSASGGTASVSLSDPADCDVTIPASGDMMFKLKAADLIEQFGV